MRTFLVGLSHCLMSENILILPISFISHFLVENSWAQHFRFSNSRSYFVQEILLNKQILAPQQQNLYVQQMS